MTGRWLAVALLATVVVAGCLGGPAESNPNVTPRETPSPGEENEVSAGTVPGVSNGTVANATALARANEAWLAESGGEVTITQSAGEGQAQYRVRIGSSFSTYGLSGSLPEGARPTSYEIWSNESTRYIRLETADDVRYRVTERERTRPNSLAEVERYLRAGAFTVAGASTGNGTVVLTAEAPTTQGDESGHSGGLSAVSGRLVVGASGQIYELNASAKRDGQPITYQYELDGTGLDRVARPAWFDEVPASATLHPDLEINPVNGSVLAIRNVGEDPVPHRSTIAVSMDEVNGTASFETELAGGDTRYAYFDAADGTLQLSAGRPESGVVDPLTSPVSVTIATDDGVTLLSMGMGWGSETASSEGSSSGGTETG